MRAKFLLMGFIGVAFSAGAALAQPTHSIWDGVYTEAQAQRGGALYQQNCAFCHGANLAGTFEIAPLTGRFMPYWSGSTLDVLLDYMNTAMPLGRMGALSRADDADILAYVLKVNGLPAGADGLSAEPAALKAITFDPAKPPPPAAPQRERRRK